MLNELALPAVISASATGYVAKAVRVSMACGELTLSLESAASLDGIIVDPEGKPLEGLEVLAWAQDTDVMREGLIHELVLGSPLALTGTTDVNGRFSIAGVEEGRPYSLVAANEMAASPGIARSLFPEGSPHTLEALYLYVAGVILDVQAGACVSPDWIDDINGRNRQPVAGFRVISRVSLQAELASVRSLFQRTLGTPFVQLYLASRPDIGSASTFLDLSYPGCTPVRTEVSITPLPETTLLTVVPLAHDRHGLPGCGGIDLYLRNPPYSAADAPHLVNGLGKLDLWPILGDPDASARPYSYELRDLASGFQRIDGVSSGTYQWEARTHNGGVRFRDLLQEDATLTITEGETSILEFDCSRFGYLELVPFASGGLEYAGSLRFTLGEGEVARDGSGGMSVFSGGTVVFDGPPYTVCLMEPGIYTVILTDNVEHTQLLEGVEVLPNRGTILPIDVLRN